MSLDPQEKLIGFSMEEVVWMCSYLNKSGILKLTSPDGTGHISFVEGNIVEVVCPGTPQLGELLVKHKLLTTEQLLPILEEQARTEKRKYIGEILISKHLLVADQLKKLLEVQSFLALKNFSRWKHPLFEFVQVVKDTDQSLSISFIGVSPYEILQKIQKSSEHFK